MRKWYSTIGIISHSIKLIFLYQFRRKHSKTFYSQIWLIKQSIFRFGNRFLDLFEMLKIEGHQWNFKDQNTLGKNMLVTSASCQISWRKNFKNRVKLIKFYRVIFESFIFKHRKRNIYGIKKKKFRNFMFFKAF